MKLRTEEKRAFTFVQLLIVVTIIGLLLAMAIPYMVRARQSSNANACINNLQMLYGAQEIYSREEHVLGTSLITLSNIAVYLPGGKIPKCPLNGNYSVDSVTNNPRCSISGHVLP
jgi:type II secretory pathway pseudopilin PulG